jgi:hypothetical protein
MTHHFECFNQTGRRASALCAMFFLLAVAASGAPAVSLSVTSGPPTTNLKISATGFPPGVLIDVYFDVTDMALRVAGPKGGFSTVLQVPAATQPGTHWVTAEVRTTGVAAQQSFLVSTNWAQQGFTAKGKRYNPYENVLSPSNVGSIDRDWSFTTGGSVYSSPVVANGIVYVGRW